MSNKGSCGRGRTAPCNSTRISLWLGEIPVQYTTTTLDVHTSYFFFKKKTNSTSPLLLLLFPPNRPSYSSSSLPYCNIRLFSQVADNGARGWGKQNVGYRGRRGIVLGLLRIRGFRLYNTSVQKNIRRILGETLTIVVYYIS